MAPIEPAVGAVVAGRFVLDERLGIGAFGTVWKAMDRERGYSPVALKLLHEHLAGEPRIKERFAREMRVLSGLQHPSIAHAIAWSEEGEAQYLAMEYVAGLTVRAELAQRTLTNEQYSLAEVGTIAKAIASALEAAHAKGIVHRDLKPNNLVLSKEGVKVLDFGIARIADVKPEDETTIGRTLGSWQYMPPEQVRGERVDERCDLFALGAIMFELLTLRRAFARTEMNEPMPASEAALDSAGINSRYNLLKRIVMEPRERPSRWREGVGEAIDRVVLRALESEREARFQSAAEMSAALTAAFAGAEKPKSNLAATVSARARAETMLPSDLESSQGEAPTAAVVLGSTRVLPQPAAESVVSARTAIAPTLLVDRDRGGDREEQTAPLVPRPRTVSRGVVSAVTVFSAVSVCVALVALYFSTRPVEDVPVKREDVAPVAEVRAQAAAEDVVPDVAIDVDPDPPAEVPETPPVVTQAKTKAPSKVKERVEPVVAPKPKEDPAVAELARAIAAAKADPENSEKLQAAAAMVREQGRALADPRVRTSIERCATTAAVAGDVDALAACVVRLREASAP